MSSVKNKIYNLLLEKKEAITYNIGIVATMLAGNDNELLEPLKVEIDFPNLTKIKINILCISGEMKLVADADKTDIDYIFINGEKVYVSINNPDIEYVLDNLAIIITNNLTDTMLKFFKD